jgi:hypothetical protein
VRLPTPLTRTNLPWYTSRNAGAASMNFTIEFFRVRSTDDSHATLDRISVAADNLEAAKVKVKSLFETLVMPQDALVARCFLSLSMRVERFFNCHWP